MSQEKNCLFCKLKDVEENIVYQTDNVYVIVDRFPTSSKHLLIIPKKHFHVIHEYDDEILMELLVVAKKLAIKLGMVKYNILQNNINHQIIPHVHIHLIECNDTGSLKLEENLSLKLNETEYKDIVKDVKEKLFM